MYRLVRSRNTILVGVAAAFLLGYWLRGGDFPVVETLRQGSGHSRENASQVHLMYACPMMCIPPQKRAGRCPVCAMELVPLAQQAQDQGAPRVTLGDEARQLAEIRTAGVERRWVSAEIEAFGQVILDQTAIFRGNPEPLWAKLFVYESDLPWLRLGQRIILRTDAYPGTSFESTLVFIGALVDPLNRTVNVGAAIDQHRRSLVPGMILRAVIHAQLNDKGDSLGSGAPDLQPPMVIPASAPLITGRRAVVYVAVPGKDGVYEGREVVLGPRTRDHYVVLAGLTGGERVVVSGAFYIDSALQIQAKPSMMNPAAEALPDARNENRSGSGIQP
ncbi:MAG: efflux RND transporter periplasmic adaptor subunit [Thermodesulfobacteriota bacterium]